MSKTIKQSMKSGVCKCVKKSRCKTKLNRGNNSERRDSYHTFIHTKNVVPILCGGELRANYPAMEEVKE